MSMSGGIPGQVSDNPAAENLAARRGIDPAQAERAVVALAAAHPRDGDTLNDVAGIAGRLFGGR